MLSRLCTKQAVPELRSMQVFSLGAQFSAQFSSRAEDHSGDLFTCCYQYKSTKTYAAACVFCQAVQLVAKPIFLKELMQVTYADVC